MTSKLAISMTFEVTHEDGSPVGEEAFYWSIANAPLFTCIKRITVSNDSQYFATIDNYGLRRYIKMVHLSVCVCAFSLTLAHL